MKKCWEFSPSKRLTLDAVIAELESILESSSQQPLSIPANIEPNEVNEAGNKSEKPKNLPLFN